MPDLYQYDKNGYQPFHYAAMYGHADIVEYLLNRSDAKTLIRSYSIVIQDGKVADKKGMPAIFLAAKIDSKKLLLFFGVGEAVSAFLLYSVRGTAPDVKSLNDILFFIGTCLLGFSDSPLYGAGVAVSTTYLSMTGIYQCIFALGNYSGQLSLLSLVGDIVNEAERWLGLSLIANFGVFVAIYVLVFPCKWLKNSLSK